MSTEKKGRPFLEVLANALQEDYRFPVLELFVFLYALSTFALTAVFFGALPSGSSAESAYNLISTASGFPIFIFLILVFKNVAFGLGGDLEHGTLQTFLAYPIRRWAIITAKLLSAIGLSLAIFIGLQFLGLSILAPAIFSSQPQVVAVTYLSAICSPLILTGIILMVTIFLRRGAIALVVGIVLYFAIDIVAGIVEVLAIIFHNTLPLQALSVFNPSIAVAAHYSSIVGGVLSANAWIPSLTEVYTFMAASYAIIIALYLLDYYLFDRRLGL